MVHNKGRSTIEWKEVSDEDLISQDQFQLGFKKALLSHTLLVLNNLV